MTYVLNEETGRNLLILKSGHNNARGEEAGDGDCDDDGRVIISLSYSLFLSLLHCPPFQHSAPAEEEQSASFQRLMPPL
jgi:hypothetical protein